MTDLFCVSGTSPTGVKQTDRPAEALQFKCPACPDVFPSKGKRRSHVYEVHKTSYFCAEHGLLFANTTERDQHWTDVHGDALAPLVTEKQAEDFVLGIPHVASESDALLIAPDVLQSMPDDKLGKHIVKGFGEAYGAAFEKLKPYVPYIREMKIRFSIRPRDKDHQLLTPIMGCSTWKEFCRTHLKRADSTIRELLAEPKSQLVVKPSVLNPDAELDQTVDQPAQQEKAQLSTPPQPSTEPISVEWLKEHGEKHPEEMLKSIKITELADSGNARAREWVDRINIIGEIAELIATNAAYEELVCGGSPLSVVALAQAIANELLQKRDTDPTPPRPPELLDDEGRIIGLAFKVPLIPILPETPPTAISSEMQWKWCQAKGIGSRWIPLQKNGEPCIHCLRSSDGETYWNLCRKHSSLTPPAPPEEEAEEIVDREAEPSSARNMVVVTGETLRKEAAKLFSEDKNPSEVASILHQRYPQITEEVLTDVLKRLLTPGGHYRGNLEPDPIPSATPSALIGGEDDHRPVTYIPDLLTKQEADALFEACSKLPFEVRQNPRNPTNPKNVIQHQVVTFLMNKSARAAYVGPTFLMSEAPKEIKEIVDFLTEEWVEGRKVTYASVVRYRDQNDHMNYHQHREDKGRNTPVLVVSTGGVHPCGFRVADKPETEEIISPVHGSLYTMTNEANDTLQHAVLKSKTETPVRYAINFKCIDDAYWTPDGKPAVFDCHAGKQYPPDAIYVGRETRDRKGKIIRPDTIFGNHQKLNEVAFRKYAAEKMQDPAFRAQVETLRGKHLLCWCGSKAKFCHAKVWLELANAR